MIPGYVEECMGKPGTAVVASRNAILEPSVIRAWAARVHPDKTTVTFHISSCHSERVVGNFKDNGRVALTIAAFGNESYQLKGRFVDWRPNNKEDDEFLDQHMAKVFGYAIQEMGFKQEDIAHFNLAIYKPSAAVTFNVEVVFGQSPHPETGKAIS